MTPVIEEQWAVWAQSDGYYFGRIESHRANALLIYKKWIKRTQIMYIGREEKAKELAERLLLSLTRYKGECDTALTEHNTRIADIMRIANLGRLGEVQKQ